MVVDLGSGADLLTDEEDATRVEVVLRTDDVALVRVPVPVWTPSPPDRVSTAGVVGWVGGVLTWVLVARVRRRDDPSPATCRAPGIRVYRGVTFGSLSA